MTVLHLIILALLSAVLQSPSVHSLDCSSQNFTNNKVYTKCIQLPTLSSTLYWNFTKENSTLSIAFIAPPETPDGWISWAINPTKTGMVGCQSLLAFKDSNGSMMVKTYNITTYTTLIEGKIAFDVPESSAEFSDGVMRIFATLKLPETINTTVNQVWQVGGAVLDGRPEVHSFLPENLKSLGKLDLTGTTNSTTTVSPPTGSTTIGSPPTSSSTTGSPPTGSPTTGSSTTGSPPTSWASSSTHAGTFWILTLIRLLLIT